MSTAGIFNSLADVMGGALAMAFPDTLTVKQRNGSQTTSGETLQSSVTDVYSNVPCLVEPIQKFGWKKIEGEQVKTTQKYLLTMPTKQNGTYIALDPDKHYFVVAARGSSPAKTLMMDAPGDVLGVLFEIVVSVEN